eukprot:2370960-Rhodomonas_salina.4
MDGQGWQNATPCDARIFQGEIMACRLVLSPAHSTQAMLAPGRGQKMNGSALQHPTHTTAGIRDYLQLRWGCFPTNAVLRLGRDFPHLSPLCPLCKQAEDTNAQMFVACPALSDAIPAAHDAVATAVFQVSGYHGPAGLCGSADTHTENGLHYGTLTRQRTRRGVRAGDGGGGDTVSGQDRAPHA